MLLYLIVINVTLNKFGFGSNMQVLYLCIYQRGNVLVTLWRVRAAIVVVEKSLHSRGF
jgi:hypothetical protein